MGSPVLDVLVQKEQNDSTLMRGVQRILSEAVQATPIDEVLLLFDETSEDFIPLFVNASIESALSITFVKLPETYQLHLAKKMTDDREIAWLPTIVKNTIINASIVLNLLSGHNDTLPVRKSILNIPRLPGNRFAHVPGISAPILTITANTDFRAIAEAGELLAWYIGNACSSRLITFDTTGHEYCLTLDLGGWDNEPLMSPGIIPPGSWGNLPAGEVFCLPEHNSVYGQVCINGSIPGTAMKSNEYVVLYFDAGRLVSWDCSHAPEILSFFENQRATASNRADENWNCFAELGIGLNESIATLTGNSLFDEKAANTIHIAVGANDVFGGPIRSDRHHDLVTVNPSLELDGIQVMDHGQIVQRALKELRASWRPPGLRESGSWANSKLLIREADITFTGGTVKRRLCRAGRIGYVDMAYESTAKQLSALCQLLIQHKNMQFNELIAQYPQFDGITTQELLAYLIHFRCVILN